MPRWNPSQTWKDQDAYIIGGGPSLKGFDWGLLRGKNTIGCNSAFILGSEIVKINIFGDYDWWIKIGQNEGAKYGGMMVACSPRLKDDPTPWLLWLGRHDNSTGLGIERPCFNGNTGSLALNLALILGARRVFLLGYDMKAPDPVKQPNWHNLRYQDGRAESYRRFIRQFAPVAKQLPVKFPGCEIWNVTDDSDLPYFPKVSVAEHFGPPVQKEGAS